MYSFNMFAKGSYYKIDIDDTVPMYNEINTNLFVMAEGVNNTMWGPLLEKAYAKFVGSYLSLATGGVSSESMRALTGFPGFMYNTSAT